MALLKKVTKTIRRQIKSPSTSLIRQMKSLAQKLSSMPPDKKPSTEDMEKIQSLNKKVSSLLKTVEDVRKTKSTIDRVKNQIEIGKKTADSLIKANKLASSLNPVAAGIQIAQQLVKDNLSNQTTQLDVASDSLDSETGSIEEELIAASEELDQSVKDNNADTKADENRKAKNDESITASTDVPSKPVDPNVNPYRES